MLRFIRANIANGSQNLSERLMDELATGKQVLWLVSGGSNILITVQAMQRIAPELTPKLSIIPMDERYGPPGHADSNVQQLMSTGFDHKQAVFYPILNGRSVEATADTYNQLMTELLFDSDVVIGQFGIGTDGHTAGILPGSPAATETDRLAMSYQASDFSRITLTFTALRRVSVAYVFAFGSDKQNALKDLQSQALPLATQPAQILKAISEVYVYNDQIEEGSSI